MAKYEAHITCPRESSDTIQRLITRRLTKWKFSAFDADPLMGDKPFAYLTSYDPSDEDMLDHMTEAAYALEAAGVPVLRQKIERIVFDTKTQVDEIRAKGRD